MKWNLAESTPATAAPTESDACGKDWCTSVVCNKCQRACGSSCKSYPAVTQMTLVQFPAAEFLQLLLAWKRKKDSAMYSCIGGFGGGLLLDLRKSDLSARLAILHFQISTLAKRRNGNHMQLGGFGRGLLLQASMMKLDIFAHSAILHFHD